MAWVLYDNFKTRQHNGNGINFASGGDTLKVMLTTSSYAVSQTAHVFKSDVTNEVSGTNYTAGGATLASKTLTVAANLLTFASATLTWLQNAAGFSTARYAVLYKDTGVAATSPLVAYLDLLADKGNVNGDLNIADSAGYFAL